MRCKDFITISDGTELVVLQCELTAGHGGSHYIKSISCCERPFILHWAKTPAKSYCMLCETKLLKYECTNCGLFVCEDCFNKKTRKCRRCSIKVIK